MKSAEDSHYIMGATTASTGNNNVNSCGVSLSHAYSILSAFEMTDASGTKHKCLLMRNPWGYTQYSFTWSKDDPNWTDQLVS